MMIDGLIYQSTAGHARKIQKHYISNIYSLNKEKLTNQLIMKSEKNKPVPEKEKSGLWMFIGIIICYAFGPGLLYFLLFYALSVIFGRGFFIYIAFLSVVVLGILIYAIKSFKNDSKEDTKSHSHTRSHSHSAPVEDSDLTSDEESAFTAGFLGGIMADRMLNDHHSADENEEMFRWQEKTRREMRDDGFIDW